MPGKINCWEYKKCGREPNGARVEELGVCPAAIYPHADGVNEGINGGRICWAIVGIYSCYASLSSLSQKETLCSDCEFHKKVLSEEGLMDFPMKKKGHGKRDKRRRGMGSGAREGS